MEGAGPSNGSQSYLQNPYYFMFAALAKPDEDVELHWLKVRVCLMLLSVLCSLCFGAFRSRSAFFVIALLDTGTIVMTVVCRSGEQACCPGVRAPKRLREACDRREAPS